jgi:hypothetical protein
LFIYEEGVQPVSQKYGALAGRLLISKCKKENQKCQALTVQLKAKCLKGEFPNVAENCQALTGQLHTRHNSKNYIQKWRFFLCGASLKKKKFSLPKVGLQYMPCHWARKTNKKKNCLGVYMTDFPFFFCG